MLNWLFLPVSVYFLTLCMNLTALLLTNQSKLTEHIHEVVMSKPTCQLNSDVLERIFSFLSFRDLLAAELCCRKWKDVIDSRRVYKQLAKRICKKKVNVPFSRPAYNKHLRDLRRNIYKKPKQSGKHSKTNWLHWIVGETDLNNKNAFNLFMTIISLESEK